MRGVRTVRVCFEAGMGGRDLGSERKYRSGLGFWSVSTFVCIGEACETGHRKIVAQSAGLVRLGVFAGRPGIAGRKAVGSTT